MFGANEPNARPTAHDKQPKMVVTRTPNLFRIALETGPRNAAEKTEVILAVKLLLVVMEF